MAQAGGPAHDDCVRGRWFIAHRHTFIHLDRRTTMFGLTPLGIFHTAVSLVAVLAGLIALLRHHAISPRSRLGRVYLVATIVTCLTAFGIFQHGGFGKPHAAAVITLGVLVLAGMARLSDVFGRASPYVETIGYSFTFFVHLIPGLTETATRLPYGAPLLSSPDDPRLQATIGVLFILFLIGATLQAIRLRGMGVAAMA
jgi:hypothetical protein